MEFAILTCGPIQPIIKNATGAEDDRGNLGEVRAAKTSGLDGSAYYAQAMVAEYNSLLNVDGWEICPVSRNSTRNFRDGNKLQIQ